MEITGVSNNGKIIHIDTWKRALDQLYGRFCDYGSRASRDFDSEDIHQARVNSRKLLTLLRILDKNDHSGLYPFIKQAQKYLGKVRDADVLIESFQARRKSAKRSGKGKEADFLKFVIQIQRKRRKRSRVKLADKLPKLMSPELNLKWRAFLQSLPELDSQGADIDVNQVMRELEVSYEQKKQTYRQLCRQYGAETKEAFDALHDLRIAAKELRYTASAASFALDPKFHSHERLYKDIQEQLGQINDRRIWLETVQEIDQDKLDMGKKTWKSFKADLMGEIRELLQASRLAGK
ncbi:CHAD domain-containing protein [Paenibacillus sp. 1_12]|uniref:CHAD domain-containing protein n=1 Tax=Paenibacillus sp. 1_12 TaxID=1566278 RepID=UPI0008E150ED|nr:CHAD domain-containing protein [Paenibacillus sp. 1_12]SFL76420.1 CHAD domain-containing protein [Paenibacillus sp. 1_12]